MRTFRLFAFRFTFQALDPVYFPPGAAGNAFRGAFGHIFRRIACRTGCEDSRLCDVRHQCAYANLFEPACLDGPSGMIDAPRPFVVRAGGLDDRIFKPGEAFSIDVHIFHVREPAVACFVLAFQQLARAGIGASRGRIRLVRVCSLDAARRVGVCAYQAGRFLTQEPPDWVELSLEPWDCEEPQPVILRFLTPTELKSNGAVLPDAPFAAVIARARDRLATLSELYGDGPLDFDFRGLPERAAQVKMVSSKLHWVAHERTSSRTHQRHSIGGFTGEVRYHGELGEFLPLLKAAYWTGIGRQTVWGKGAIELIWQGRRKEPLETAEDGALGGETAGGCG